MTDGRKIGAAHASLDASYDYCFGEREMPREFYNQAHEAYENWRLAGCPAPENLNQTLLLAVGYVLDCADGRPTHDERELLAQLKPKRLQVEAR